MKKPGTAGDVAIVNGVNSAVRKVELRANRFTTVNLYASLGEPKSQI